MPPSRIIIDTDPGIDDIIALLLALSAPASALEVLLISITYGNVEVDQCLRNVVTMFRVLEREVEWRKERGRGRGSAGKGDDGEGAEKKDSDERSSVRESDLSPEREVGFEGITHFRPIVAVGAARPLHEQLLMADYFHGRDGLAGMHTTHEHLSVRTGSWEALFDLDSSSAPSVHIPAFLTPAPASNAPPPQAKTLILPESEAIGSKPFSLFVPSKIPAHKEILRLLRENEPDTITIVAIGPLTNLALAAAEDVTTFLRVKEVVAMGGALDAAGNVTPTAEFNVFADSIAAARIFALTSSHPETTLPPSQLPNQPPMLPPPLPRRLNLSLFPVDITSQHVFTREILTTPPLSSSSSSSLLSPLRNNHPQPLQPSQPSQPSDPSPLKSFLTAFLTPMFSKLTNLYPPPRNNPDLRPEAADLALHDPLCIYYLLTRPGLNPEPGQPRRTASAGGQVERRVTTTDPEPKRRKKGRAKWISTMEDIRVETQGQWTRGMTVVDRRGRGAVDGGARAEAQEFVGGVTVRESKTADGDGKGEKIGGGEAEGVRDASDHGAWLGQKGNLVRRMIRADFGDGEGGGGGGSGNEDGEMRLRIGKEMLEMILEY